MTVNRAHTDAPQISAAELVDRLGRFDGPPEQFIVNLLAVQCHLATASGGSILRPSREGGIEVVAVYPQLPEGSPAPVWLARAAEAAPNALNKGETTITPIHDEDDLYGQGAKRHLVMIPLRGGAGIRGVAAFYMDTAERSRLAQASERLELTVSLLSLYEMRLTLQHRQMDLQRLRTAVEVLAVANDNDKFTGAAMAFCNEISSRWHCNRVSLGFLKGRYVKLKAMSDTEKFDRKTEPVQRIEGAMEECLDQDVEVVYPAGKEATYVSRAHGELSQRFGPSAIVSLPLRHDGEPIGVLTIERNADSPFDLDEVEPLRLTCDLSTARLANLEETGRWFGARAATAVRKGAAAAVGPKHTWIKLLGIGILALVLFLVFAKGDYDVKAPFVVEAEQRQMVPAPYNGILDTVHVEPGDEVSRGALLAELDTAEMVIQLAEARKEYETARKKGILARQQDKPGEADIWFTEAEKIRSRIELLEWRVAQAEISAPISGTVLKGELKRRIGARVEKGDTLFEVAPLDTMRAELSVPEDMVAEMLSRQKDGELAGEMATVSQPDRRLPFVVEEINPVAEVVDQQNVFKVKVRFKDLPPGVILRPGLEGVSHVTVGERRYVWLWTHKLVNWIRMKLWI